MAILYGVAHGNLEDIAHTISNKQQEQILSTVAGIFPTGRVFRHGIKISSAAFGSTFDQSTHDYDQLFFMMRKYGFESVINIHPGSASGVYFIPGNSAFGGAGTTYTQWENRITDICNRYAPGGTFGVGTSINVYGSITSMTSAGLTWPGVRRFEIWNEPNSPTGNAGDTTGTTGGMNASDCWNILFHGSKAIRTHGNANGWTPYIIGLALATTAGGMKGYWKTVVDWGLAHGSAYTIGAGPLAGVYGPNPHDFVDALGIHPYSSVDPNSTTLSTAIKTNIGNLRIYCDANGGAGLPFFISEWGWRGHNLANQYKNPSSVTTTLTAGVTLPVATLPVASAAAFVAPGQVQLGSQTVKFTGKTGTSLTGCTGGTGPFANGAVVSGNGATNTEWEGIADQGVGQGSQEGWEMGGIDVIQATTSWLIDGACTYQTTDDNSGGSTQNLGIFYNPLAASAAGPIPDSSLKAVALAYRTKLASAPAPSIEQHVNIMQKGRALRVTQ